MQYRTLFIKTETRLGCTIINCAIETCFSNSNQFEIQVAPRQGGAYWAPELVNENVLIWSFSEGFNAEAPVTCVGIATSTGSLNDMTWTNAGQPMFCINQKDYEERRGVIDPSVFTGFDGKKVNRSYKYVI